MLEDGQIEEYGRKQVQGLNGVLRNWGAVWNEVEDADDLDGRMTNMYFAKAHMVGDIDAVKGLLASSGLELLLLLEFEWVVYTQVGWGAKGWAALERE